MRDIRPDLKERIALAADKTAKLNGDYSSRLKALQDEFQPQLQEAQSEESLLRAMLAAEDKRLGPTPAQNAFALPKAGLADFFIQQIQARSPISKEELRSLAEKEGYFAGDGGGRPTHSTLLNLVRAGRISELGDNKYGPRGLSLAEAAEIAMREPDQRPGEGFVDYISRKNKELMDSMQKHPATNDGVSK